MDKTHLKHEKKEMKMAKKAQKHVSALRKIADGLEAMHAKIPEIKKSSKRSK